MNKLMLAALTLTLAACTTPHRMHAPEPIVSKGQPFVEKSYNDLVDIAASSQVFPVSPRIVMIPDSDFDGVSDEADKCPGTVEKTKVNANGCPLDTDKDGISDGLDKCPDTPVGIKVNANGCTIPSDVDKDSVPDAIDKCPNTPANTKVDSSGCPYIAIQNETKGKTGNGSGGNNAGNHTGGGSAPVSVNVINNNYINGINLNDKDQDGVNDDEDKCPDSLAKTRVDAKGCPLESSRDSDKDGVIDQIDHCLGTALGIKVDSVGCALLQEDVAIDLHVLFATGKAVIIDNAYADILKIADFMRTYRTAILTIEGHTDSRSSELFNQRLSERRAQAVRRELIRFGVDSSRLQAVGYGELRPIMNNDTEEGRAKNRRVVATAKAQTVKNKP